MRIFISLNISDEVISRVRHVQNELRESFRDYSIRWENPDKFHMTLRFLGEMQDESLSELTYSLGELKFDFDTINLLSTDIGYFPNSRRPNVIYLGFKENGDNINKLVSAVDNVLKNFSIVPDKKFVPHLTLGRFRKDERKSADKIKTEKPELILINFNCFNIMQSKLSPKGSVYTIIKEIHFNNK